METEIKHMNKEIEKYSENKTAGDLSHNSNEKEMMQIRVSTKDLIKLEINNFNLERFKRKRRKK